ncbi:histone-lysine N-methyltransferase family member SUVH2-like [Typha latifolia]|uniref:histone-lysine N-methyltransferase family member SUVH2-like n=1 Tax=Typha latifolia TaxID=4733 RepID=UPI003C30E56E
MSSKYQRKRRKNGKMVKETNPNEVIGKPLLAMDTSPPLSSPLLDFLSLLPLTPKLEPLETNNGGIADPSPDPVSLLTPELCDRLLGELIPAASDDDPLFSRYLRLAQLELSAAVAATPSTALVVAKPKKKRARSGEMVRVSQLLPGDRIHFLALVRRTRITYDCLRSLCLRELESPPGRRTRSDLKAAKKMLDHGLWLHRDRRIIGSLPGISIGDVFFYRAELCIVGVHGAVQAGIDYVAASQVPEGEPIATSIIASGGYQDDEDSDDVLIYTGSGGRGRNDIHHSADQKLERGNLALERSMSYGVEVRVVRGLSSEVSPTGKVYVYDGLYKVVECRCVIGKSGCQVYRFKLLRIQGQEVLGSKILKLAEELKAKLASKVRPAGYLLLDISRKMEAFPVPLFNDVDKEQDPWLFEYLPRPEYPRFVSKRRGCRCTLECSEDCVCAKRNNFKLAYDGNGTLLRGRPIVYECGDSCHCTSNCPNRVSQKGLRHRLEVFRSRETGWGVRSLDLIQAGAFICEFSGEVLIKEKIQEALVDGRSVIDPKRFPERWKEWGDVSDALPDEPPPVFPRLREPRYLLDVSSKRNVACYISHSGRPNVFVQFVLFGHDNESYPHLMVFAMENIPPLRELSIDYGIGDG